MKANGEIERALIKAMGEKIEEISRLTGELRELGKGIPVIEKNARCILSFIHTLEFGISDVVRVMDNQYQGES